jgi:hypothetical protein
VSVTDTNINVLLRRVDKDHDPWTMAKPYPNCDMEGATRKLLLQTRRGYAPLKPTPTLSSPRVSVRCEHVSNLSRVAISDGPDEAYHKTTPGRKTGWD